MSQVIHLGKLNPRLKYAMKSEEIEERDTIKDFGVWMDSRVSFSGHIAKVCFSANTLVGLFRRTYVHITAEIFKIFYKVFIRPS